jgi:hypothetical protein
MCDDASISEELDELISDEFDAERADSYTFYGCFFKD